MTGRSSRLKGPLLGTPILIEIIQSKNAFTVPLRARTLTVLLMVANIMSLMRSSTLLASHGQPAFLVSWTSPFLTKSVRQKGETFLELCSRARPDVVLDRTCQ